jgi:hypothetical protein
MSIGTFELTDSAKWNVYAHQLNPSSQFSYSLTLSLRWICAHQVRSRVRFVQAGTLTLSLDVVGRAALSSDAAAR